MTLTDRQIKNIAAREGVDGDELIDLVRAWEADGASMGKTAVENLAWELRRGEAPRPNPPYRERLPGGLASGLSPKDFDPIALRKGTEVELEHTGDRAIAREIAMDHLTEDPRYYEKLEMIENPPWSDRALKQNWGAIKTAAYSQGLPMPEGDIERWKFEELGCGHYGCVIDTEDPGIVFKLTSDPTEAEFIQLAEPLGWPEGIVKYYAIVPLDFTFRKRTVFAIWREEAFDVGQLSPGYGADNRDYEVRLRREFELQLLRYKDHAARFRDGFKKSKDPQALLEKSKQLEDWAWDYISEYSDMAVDGRPSSPYGNYPRNYSIDNFRGAERMALSWRACQYIAEMMGSTDMMQYVGEAFGFYMDNGFLLADVHIGNVGKVAREDYYKPIWVITDPGHVVVL